ncbi:MAG: hypothetical protein M3442_18915 [Chloroflexota bacterium]|nr:hypothetical protein [Chloroflexota bacterium]
MPDFSRAQVSTSGADLSAYSTFLRRLVIGQTVTLPLEPGETSRKVMRDLNAAAGHSQMRLARLGSDRGAVRFRVVSLEKRSVTITAEQKQARVEKARATRAARRSQRDIAQDVEFASDLDPASGDGQFGAEVETTDPISKDAVPPAQQVQEPAVQEVASPPKRRRRRTSTDAESASSGTENA